MPRVLFWCLVWITLGISIVLPLLLGLYDTNLPSPSLNLLPDKCSSQQCLMYWRRWRDNPVSYIWSLCRWGGCNISGYSHQLNLYAAAWPLQRNQVNQSLARAGVKMKPSFAHRLYRRCSGWTLRTLNPEFMEHVIRHAIPMIVVKGSPNKGIIIVHDASLIPYK